MTRRILPLYGFKPYNQMVCLSHPLHPVESGPREAAINWKMPLQIVRNAGCRLGPSGRLLHGCEVITGRSPEIVPASLGMKQIPGQAVSLRSAELLAHIAACPLFGIRFSPSFGDIVLIRRSTEFASPIMDRLALMQERQCGSQTRLKHRRALTFLTFQL